VALTPEGLVAAGASGFAAGGIPGAIASVAGAAVANFARASGSARVVSFPPGHPKEPLQAPYFLVMRQFQGVLGQMVIDQKFGHLSPSELARIPDKAFDVGRFGGIVIQLIFNAATVDQIKAVIGTPAETVVETRRILEGGDPRQEDEEMVFNPVTGVDQPPERVDRGRYNEGLGNELVSQPVAKSLAPSIVPTIEIGRYIQHPMVLGINRAFVSNVLVPVSTTTTFIRIPAADAGDGFIYVRRVRYSLSADEVTSPNYTLTANASGPSSTGIISKMHFQAIRDTSGFTVGEASSEKEYGEFTVPQGLDYVIHIVNLAAAALRIGIGVEAFFVPNGVNGSYC